QPISATIVNGSGIRPTLDRASAIGARNSMHRGPYSEPKGGGIGAGPDTEDTKSRRGSTRMSAVPDCVDVLPGWTPRRGSAPIRVHPRHGGDSRRPSISLGAGSTAPPPRVRAGRSGRHRADCWPVWPTLLLTPQDRAEPHTPGWLGVEQPIVEPFGPAA